MGDHGNVTIIRNALHEALRRRGLDAQTADPWYFPTPDEYQTGLEAHDFRVASIELIPRPTPLPGDISGWLATFAESFTNQLPLNERMGLVDEVREVLRPLLCDEQGQWTADYVRLRFAAILVQIKTAVALLGWETAVSSTDNWLSAILRTTPLSRQKNSDSQCGV